MLLFCKLNFLINKLTFKFHSWRTNLFQVVFAHSPEQICQNPQMGSYLQSGSKCSEVLPDGARTEQWPAVFKLPGFLDVRIQCDLKKAQSYYKANNVVLALNQGEISKFKFNLKICYFAVNYFYGL